MIPEHLHLGTGSGFASRSQVLLIFLRVYMCLVTHMWLLLQVWSPEVRSSQMSMVQTAKSAYKVWVISSKRKKTSGGMIHLTYFSCLHSMKRVFLFVGDKAELDTDTAGCQHVVRWFPLTSLSLWGWREQTNKKQQQKSPSTSLSVRFFAIWNAFSSKCIFDI